MESGAESRCILGRRGPSAGEGGLGCSLLFCGEAVKKKQ